MHFHNTVFISGKIVHTYVFVHVTCDLLPSCVVVVISCDCAVIWFFVIFILVTFCLYRSLANSDEVIWWNLNCWLMMHRIGIHKAVSDKNWPWRNTWPTGNGSATSWSWNRMRTASQYAPCWQGWVVKISSFWYSLHGPLMAWVVYSGSLCNWFMLASDSHHNWSVYQPDWFKQASQQRTLEKHFGCDLDSLCKNFHWKPQLWNSLPPSLHDSSLSLNAFKQKLNVHFKEGATGNDEHHLLLL